jgi:hypothetical protein
MTNHLQTYIYEQQRIFCKAFNNPAHYPIAVVNPEEPLNTTFMQAEWY